MAKSRSTNRIRFGVFEIDLNSRELRKQGLKIKLHEQPFKILTELVEHAGEVIAREYLCEKLWPTGTFVDAEGGLNSAIRKIRDALGDSPESPRFIETLPRLGYRFIVEVERSDVGVPAESQGLSEAENSDASIFGDFSGRLSVAEGAESVDDRDSKTDEPGSGKAVLRTIVVVMILLTMGACAWLAMRQRLNSYSIAVLPLKNLSTDAGSDFFSEGLTDEIIQNLSIIDGLEVKSRTSSFAFKEGRKDIHQVGEQLKANMILEGSVLRQGNRLRVIVRLIRVKDDYIIWSSQYDRELKDVFDIQNDISRSIVNELRLKIGRGQRRYNTNLDAYDDYLQAGVLLNKTPGADSESIAASIPLFEGAIAKDPGFAPAYAGIGNAYAYLSATPRTFSPGAAYPKMREACEKALQLDPLLPEAHACMGLVYSRDCSWKDAEKSFLRALELNPNLSRSRQDFALWVLTPQGRINEALDEIQTALALDPVSPATKNAFGYVLMIAGRNEEAISNSRKALSSDPDNYSAKQLIGRAMVQEGKTAEGITLLEKLGLGSESFLGYAYAHVGRADDAKKLISQYPDFPWIQAVVNGALGNSDQAFEGLNRMLAMKDPRVGNFIEFPELSSLRGDPRLSDVRKRLNLPQTQ
jgi:TolB-like protein/DNA-binding winged helix-turn-helix (wHTH) protein/Flp pilus assembly protein TadD